MTNIKHALGQLKDALSLRHADGRDLTRIGRNNAVSRPKFNATDDELYRKLIPKLSWSPKMVKKNFWDILEIFVGKYEDGLWDVYQPKPNQIVVEISDSAISPTGLASATYLQRQLTPVVSTTLSANALIGATSLTVVDTTGSPTTGFVHIGLGQSKEVIKYTSFGATTYTLDHGLQKNHVSGVPVNIYQIETSTTSYIGDYFVSTPRTVTLGSPITIGQSTATLSTANHQLPPVGIIWFEELDSLLREKHYAKVSGTTVTLADTTFINNHAAGIEVKWFDLSASVNESSGTGVGGNPIILYTDTLLEDIKQTLSLIKASGVELIIKRV